MQATKEHISLETAMMMKITGIKNEYSFYEVKGVWHFQRSGLKHFFNCTVLFEIPAFTWLEILWEYPKTFFGEKIHYTDCSCLMACTCPQYYKYEIYTRKILSYLQREKYSEADECFREHCILIKK